MTSTATKRVLVIGVVSLDVVRSPDGAPALIRFGGVSHNVACVLAAVGCDVAFLSPRYVGDVGRLVETHLRRIGVKWQPLEVPTELALFTATVGAEGALQDATFTPNGALDPFDPETLDSLRGMDGYAAVITCTDVPTPALVALHERARASSVPVWLVASDPVTACRVPKVRPAPDVLCLNLKELEAASNDAPTSAASVARIARRLVRPTGAALVTLGAEGAILVDVAQSRFLHQRSTERLARSALGAGDVAAAFLLADRIAGRHWEEALPRALAAAEHFIRVGPRPAPTFDRVEPRPPLEPGPEAFAL